MQRRQFSHQGLTLSYLDSMDDGPVIIALHAHWMEAAEIGASITLTKGSHWDTWLASDCPALLIGGDESRITTPMHLQEMADRRPNTSLHILKGGHVLHKDNPSAFTACVKAFLEQAG